MIVGEHFPGFPYSGRRIHLRGDKPFDYNWNINDFMRSSLRGKDDKLVREIVDLFQNWDKLPPWERPKFIWVFEVFKIL